MYFRIYLDEEFIWKILIQLTLALQECHQRKNGRAVLHRDMKPANVFLDTDKNVKLGDFGLARVLHHETSFANTYVGTPYYMSPVSSLVCIMQAGNRVKMAVAMQMNFHTYVKKVSK